MLGVRWTVSRIKCGLDSAQEGGIQLMHIKTVVPLSQTCSFSFLKLLLEHELVLVVVVGVEGKELNNPTRRRVLDEQIQRNAKQTGR